MWIFHPLGFFSATLTNPTYNELPQEQQRDHIMVRARVRSDLVRLVRLHQHNKVGEKPEILELRGHDYPYRIIIPHREWTLLVTVLSNEIDYSNFKNAVEDQAPTQLEGHARHDLYLKVWSVMNRAEDWLARRMEQITSPKSKQQQFNYMLDPRQDWELFGADLPYETPSEPDPIFDPFDPGPRGTPPIATAPRGKGEKGKKGRK